jgi:hypothetical protein
VDDDFYEIEGRKYQRCTRVIGFFEPPQLTAWKLRTKDHKRIGRKAMDIGSRVDGMCLADWKGDGYNLTDKDPAEVRECMKAWETWKTDFPELFRDIQAMQETVFYDDWECAGTLDIRTSRAIIDIKTSGRISKGYWIQTAFYNRKFGLPGRFVLRLDKEGSGYEFVECPAKYSQEYLENLFVGRLINMKFEEEDSL